MELREALDLLEHELRLDDDDPARFRLRSAWRVARRHMERGRKISSTTLPRIALLAQRAVVARDAVRDLVRLLPPEGYAGATRALDELQAILAELGAAPMKPPPIPPSE